MATGHHPELSAQQRVACQEIYIQLMNHLARHDGIAAVRQLDASRACDTVFPARDRVASRLGWTTVQRIRAHRETDGDVRDARAAVLAEIKPLCQQVGAIAAARRYYGLGRHMLLGWWTWKSTAVMRQ